MSKALKCCPHATRQVYRLAPNDTPGVLNREWHGTKPAVPIAQSTTAVGRDFRLCHDFSLPTTTNTVINTADPLELNDTDNTAVELDIQTLDTIINVPAGGVWIQYQGGSEGYWAIEVGECCGPLELKDELGYADREDASSIVGPVYLPPGQHYFRAWNIDSGGTNSSHNAWYSTDGGNTFGPFVPPGVEFSIGKRAVECQTIPVCDETPEGWTDCPPSDCEQTFPKDTTDGGNAGLDAAGVKAAIEECFAGPDAPEIVHPAQEICNGNFVDVTSRAGWLHTWSPVYTTSSGTITDDWEQVSTAETSPNCETDVTVNVSLGNSYFQLRNMYGRAWYDVRLLVNGAPVNTWTFQNYHYDDDLGTTNLDDDITPLGSVHFARTSVPAGAVITVEILRRYNFVAGNTAVVSPYGRVISGLRAHFNVHYSPTTIVTGRA